MDAYRIIPVSVREFPDTPAKIPCYRYREFLARALIWRWKCTSQERQRCAFAANSLLFSLITGNYRREWFEVDWLHSQPPAHGPLCGEALRKMARRRPHSGLCRQYKRANRAGDWPSWREFGEFSLGVRMVVSVAGTAHRGIRQNFTLMRAAAASLAATCHSTIRPPHRAAAAGHRETPRPMAAQEMPTA
jgi:hypothetical protein